ncbi:HlyD family secretion protein [Echinicola vietnamensis]|uniref:Multidrug resistance efflux pump n=1 Tax=Echinicola vietnamensis (strain DSM 17526 / LMG 23754 / KMM 6221) TaxID=926556 RepID=L0FYM8_ECHVK|nr:hypothetical protein [Echinicola vietnamensis]AGA77750.1 hypothetical protein Echvi_1484 [Echinicola vietnamensis DSM 17526]
MSKFTYILTFWIIIIGCLIYVNFNLSNFNNSFYGIAENNDFVVSYGGLVEIKEIHVVSGQNVTKGDTLIEVIRPELDQRIREISDQLVTLRSQKIANEMNNQSMISQLEAEIKAKRAEIESQIRQIEMQYDINKSLTNELKSLKFEADSSSTLNPTEARINSLNKDLELLTSPLKLRIEQLKAQSNPQKNPHNIQIQNLENELNKLKQEKKKLIVYAQADGVIGTVGFKSGEIVSPYTPILILNSQTPSYITGFIHENSYQNIQIADQVQVQSLADNSKKLMGEVVGVGSNIAEYPERLRKNMEVRLWGREIQVKIPKQNQLLLGEKVILKKTH